MGGSGWEEAQSLLQVPEGGFTVVGATPTQSYDKDLWLIKLDQEGRVEWNKSYGLIFENSNIPCGDKVYAVLQPSDGEGFILAGETATSILAMQFWLIKTDPFGEMLWNHTYGGATTDTLSSAIHTSDDRFVLIGYTISYEDESDDFFVVKTDAEGIMQWNRSYGTARQEDGEAIAQISDEGLVAVGRTSPRNGISVEIVDDIWLVKIGGAKNYTCESSLTTNTFSYGDISSFLFILVGVSVVIIRKQRRKGTKL